MHGIAPLRLAESWDNVGLLLGAADRPLDGPVMLTIDLSERVAEEAARDRCCAVIAYHPPIFHPLKRITGASSGERVLLKLMGAGGIAVYSPHTALDAAEGGLTDWLADGLLGVAGAGIASRPSSTPGAHAGADRRALRAASEREPTQEVKVVTFLPHDDVEKVRGALSSIGAGLIGLYESCSFTTGGHGSFRGLPGSNPAVGKSGELEQVPETRLEMVCSRRALPLAMEMIRRFHPYEEPPVDVYELQAKPTRGAGAGRRITFDHPVSLAELARRLKAYLGVSAVSVAPRESEGAAGLEKIMVTRAGVVPGSGGELAGAAREDACDVFVTGEMKHHELRAAVSAGLSVIQAGHTQSERGYLPLLARRLSEQMPGIKFLPAREDRPPEVLV